MKTKELVISEICPLLKISTPTAYIGYSVYGGEVAYYQAYDALITKDFVEVDLSKLNKYQLAKLQSKVDEHLAELKRTNLEYENDEFPNDAA